MYQVMDHVTRLFKHSSRNKLGASKSEREEIETLVLGLSQDARDIATHASLKSPTYRLSSQALARHFNDIQTAYRNHDLPEARRLLVATPMACASCHMQLPTEARPIWPLDEGWLEGSRLEKADFLLAAHDYDKAEQIYDRIIREYPEASSSVEELQSALNHKLTIYLRNRRDFIGARKSLEADERNDRLPMQTLQDIRTWKKDLERLKRNAWLRKLPSSSRDLKAWTDQLLSRAGEDRQSSFIEETYLAGLIYESLHHEKIDQETPELLYRLALLENRNDERQPFGLSLAYLRECLDRFAHAPIARKCLNAFEIQLRQSRALEGLDSDQERELQDYRKKLRSAP
jgi:tetratricopeptide (TPR) repeat protein